MKSHFDSEVLEILENAIQEDEGIDHALYERVVVFNCLGTQFGLFSKDVYEILRTRELMIYQVPRTRKGILGMINLRGDIIPVVSFRERYGDVHMELEPFSEMLENKKSNRIIIASANQIRFGLYVEQVVGLLHLAKEDFETEYIPMIEFSTVYEGKPIYILRLDELF